VPSRLLFLSGAAMLSLLGACHTVREVRPADLEAHRPPESVWVTFPNHSTMYVQQPELSGDTLVGMVYGEPQRVVLNDSVAIKTREAAPMKTAALAIAGGVVLLGTFMYLQNRPDVGTTGPACYYNIIGSTVNPCCQGTPDSLPC